MILYSYWRSTAAYRIRIALNLLGIDYELRSVNLVKDGGEQHKDEYKSLNPQGLVPTLIDGNVTLTQSLAILEYLAETQPSPPLLPAAPADRAKARQLATIICTDIHPLNNLRVLQYLKHQLNIDDDGRNIWYEHWVREGFRALETLLSGTTTGPYCLGKDVSIADICLVPQIYNAHRFEIPLDEYPTLIAIEAECLKLDAFDKARPENQPDAPGE
ncbi:MAG: maleylacetoacetate isomerase [Gammaproteobacteria bacterium]